ncbi:MAG: DUF2628 domain-containing protein [Cohaesibacteraceae bacterium]
MKLYSVFEPPLSGGTAAERAEKLVFVRHGWSLAALLIAPIWMLLRRLWIVLLLYLVVGGAIQVLGLVLAPWLAGALSIALALIIMVEAGQLRLEMMAGKGYREIAVIEARNQREAERKFFSTWLAEPTDPRPTPATPAPQHTVLRPTSSKPPALPGLPQ